MIRYFRAVLAALQTIADTLGRAHELLAVGIREWSGVEDFEQRLGALEREIDKRQAQAEATLERAESKFKSARAAEERARYHAQSAERDAEGDEEGQLTEEQIADYMAALQGGDVAGSGENGMHPVSSGVASRAAEKEALRRSKLGG